MATAAIIMMGVHTSPTNHGQNHPIRKLSGSIINRIVWKPRRTLSYSSSVSVKRTLYISLVRSQFNFCSQLWSPAYIGVGKGGGAEGAKAPPTLKLEGDGRLVVVNR